MSYAIVVRSLADPNRQRLLAYDIDDRDEAADLAGGLAGSYPRHGSLPEDGAYWFGDDDGLHAILVAPL